MNNFNIKLYIAICLLRSISRSVILKSDTFPKNFRFGASTSAYQIEGAWNESKGENIWDHVTHYEPDKIADKSNADVACDSYHKLKEDIAIIKDLGLDIYRFSLSWSRIFPTGHANQINSDGIKYYKDLIQELVNIKVIPVITLFHWDVPQPIQNLGGATNPLIIEYFIDYANFAFKTFGDKVNLWFSFNAPLTFCSKMYEDPKTPIIASSPGIGVYLCVHNIIKAHARTYHLYKNVYSPSQKGRLGIVVGTLWNEPFTNSPADIEAANRNTEFLIGIIANPVFHTEGDYPDLVKEFVSKRSQKEGYSKSRLPNFTDDEIRYIKGTSDIFGSNYYSTVFVADNKDPPIGDPSTTNDMRTNVIRDPQWPESPTNKIKVVPWGLRKVLNWIKNKYNNPEIMLMENGYSDAGDLNDKERIRYLELHLQNLLQSIHEDGVDVTTYAMWSLMDNFEWEMGYTQKMGLYHVNFSDPALPRAARASANYFKEIISQRRLVASNISIWTTETKAPNISTN